MTNRNSNRELEPTPIPTGEISGSWGLDQDLSQPDFPDTVLHDLQQTDPERAQDFNAIANAYANAQPAQNLLERVRIKGDFLRGLAMSDYLTARQQQDDELRQLLPGAESRSRRKHFSLFRAKAALVTFLALKD